MKKVFFYSLLSCLFMASCSETDGLEDNKENSQMKSEIRSIDEALQIAKNSISMLENQASTRATTKNRRISLADSKVIQKDITRSSANTIDTLMYVFNFEDSLGFAIVAAPMCIDGLLAVTEEGYYDPDVPSEIDGFNAFMEKAKEYCQNAYFAEEGIEDNSWLTRISEGSIDEWKDSVWYVWTNVWPLINVKWGQRHPEGEFCENELAGCSNTAMAQILTYFEYPDTIQLTYPNADKSYEVLDWTNIKSHTTGHTLPNCSTPDTHTSISRLLREVGSLCHSQYNTSSTSTFTELYAPIAFNSLGYSVGGWIDYTLTDALNSLNVSRPLLIEGFTYDSVGHVWVLDGYRKCRKYRQKFRRIDYSEWNPIGSPQITTTYYMHYNWGWYGNSNGYFHSNVFNTSMVYFPDTNQNTAQYNFKYDVKMMSVYR